MTERAAFCQLMGNLAASMPKLFRGAFRLNAKVVTHKPT